MFLILVVSSEKKKKDSTVFPYGLQWNTSEYFPTWLNELLLTIWKITPFSLLAQNSKKGK